MQRLLSRFVHRGDLVFDIGANRGDYVDVLLGLHADVVAVEPNPELAQLIRSRYRVTVESAAVGASEGEVELRLGRYDEHSTISTRWVDTIGEDRFEGSVRVPMTTLERLQRRYGRPAFVKVDVEGAEPEVLSGMGEPVAALSLEFQRAALELTAEALALLEDYAFNYVQAPTTSFALAEDVAAAELLERLRAIPDETVYGDVYAVRKRD